MNSSLTTNILAVGVAAALAIPLSASARHHRSGDVVAGIVVGALVGTAIAASSSSIHYVPVCPTPGYYPAPPPPPPVYYYTPAPRPPVYYYGPSCAPQPVHYRRRPPRVHPSRRPHPHPHRRRYR